MAIGFMALVAALIAERIDLTTGLYLFLLLIVAGFFPVRYTRPVDFAASLALYGVAKLLEAADRPVFGVAHVVSGHTMKHVLAALSAYWILRGLRLRIPTASANRIAASRAKAFA